jgi:hypothetical protein
MRIIAMKELVNLRGRIARHGSCIKKHRAEQTLLIKEHSLLSKLDAETRIRTHVRAHAGALSAIKHIKYQVAHPHCEDLERRLRRRLMRPGIDLAYMKLADDECLAVTYFSHRMLRTKQTHYLNRVYDYGVLWCKITEDEVLGPRMVTSQMFTDADASMLEGRRLGPLRRVSKGFLSRISGFRLNLALIASFVADPYAAREYHVQSP